MDDGLFHIERIIDLMMEQYPEEIDIIKQLQNSKYKAWIRKAYVVFENKKGPKSNTFNQKRVDAIALEDDKEGTIVIDILEDGSIKGFEFVDQITDR